MSKNGKTQNNRFPLNKLTALKPDKKVLESEFKDLFVIGFDGEFKDKEGIFSDTKLDIDSVFMGGFSTFDLFRKSPIKSRLSESLSKLSS